MMALFDDLLLLSGDLSHWHARAGGEDAARLEGALEVSRQRRGDLRDEMKLARLRCEQLELICHGLWELLEARAPVTDEELAEKLLEVDLRDGVQDGRLRKAGAAHRCPRCDRALSKTLGKCLYCPGAE